jgi:hypothetical protein
MKQYIELGAVRIAAAIQNFCANVDFEVLSLPGGSLIVILVWLYGSAMGPIRRAATQVRSRSTIDARSFVPERLSRPNGACAGCGC